MKDSMLQQLLQVGFALTFFAVRIVCGTFVKYEWWTRMTPEYEQGIFPRPIIAVYRISCLSLYVLNIFWFFLIARKALSGDAKKAGKKGRTGGDGVCANVGKVGDGGEGVLADDDDNDDDGNDDRDEKKKTK